MNKYEPRLRVGAAGPRIGGHRTFASVSVPWPVVLTAGAALVVVEVVVASLKLLWWALKFTCQLVRLLFRVLGLASRGAASVARPLWKASAVAEINRDGYARFDSSPGAASGDVKPAKGFNPWWLAYPTNTEKAIHAQLSQREADA